MSGNERRVVDSTLPTAEPSDSSMPEIPGPSGDASQNARTKRRRRAANSDNQKNQMFYFVDSNSSSKEKRAHVMRHHVQEKRKQRKFSHGMVHESPNDSKSWLVRKDYDPDTNSGKDISLVGTPGSTTDPNTSLPIRFSNVNHNSQMTGSMQVGSPITTLDASRKDPVSSLPTAQTPEDEELVDYWHTKLTYWSGQNPHIKNQIFRTAMQHPLSFQACILLYCARWKAQLLGIPDAPEVQRRVAEARKQIADGLTGSKQVPPDYLALALAGIALSEWRFGSMPEAQAYLEQGARIMRPRTGSNLPIETMLHYVRHIMPPISSVVEPSDRHWLVIFLRRADDLMQIHNNPEFLRVTPQRREAFQMESPLFPLLSSGPRPSQVPHASRMYVVRDPQTQEVSRTAALIYITAALWGFKDSVSKTRRFLSYLHSMVEHHQLGRHPACETLLWLLLEQECDPDLQNPERSWSTGELLKTHRRLRPDLQFHFNEILMGFLHLHPPVRGIDVFEQELEEI
ncbi:uncharacterized protein N7477_005867 [Penicillium maclennaniae]|uniref:uncharacterized protein n=1 Tax=Penicillium maclennaniae TaxID=1343394 RepID=UPI00253F9F79|nr:uncharacterized protein N7477_005867 [Penicillium maclennaniae]KAJ5670504.1 hypothetical protein N7477_005867 [Penicillium maclennaniae]